MKVLLVQPPIEDFYETSVRTYPLALFYLASAIEDICDVSVADLRTGRKPKKIAPSPFPELAGYYRDDVTSCFSTFRSYYRFGADDAGIRECIRNAAPHIIAVSASCTTYANEAVAVTKIAKALEPAIITVAGGTHPTIFPEHMINEPSVDYVIRGEGETPLRQLIQSLSGQTQARLSQIPGLCCKNGTERTISGIHSEAHIDTLPARHLIDPGTYTIGKNTYAFFLLSRGCPFKCKFCGKPPVPYRKRTLNSIEKELEQCASLNIHALDFEDDLLNVDRSGFHRILHLLTGRGFLLSAMNGIYAHTIDTDTLELMHKAGFRRLNFSLVDIDASTLAGQRRTLPHNFINCIPYLEQSPFLTEVHFIIGLPEQTADTIIETMLYLMGMRALLGPSIFYLSPNSELFNSLVPHPEEMDVRKMRSSYMFEANSSLPRRSLHTFIKLARFINHVKSLIDRNDGISRLSELADAPAHQNSAHADIFRALLNEFRFMSYNARLDVFQEDIQDTDLVRYFFHRAFGKTIKGFKTNRQIIFDIR